MRATIRRFVSESSSDFRSRDAPRGDDAQRRAEIVADHGDELLLEALALPPLVVLQLPPEELAITKELDEDLYLGPEHFRQVGLLQDVHDAEAVRFLDVGSVQGVRGE